ncbi:MAG TPA: dTDP-4-dehydrorhamnose reductase [Polyangiaceae bacterium]|nr:dTDP-4-dehydrorhamnose reductase [Polyangiaceae bacterium]
MGRLLLISPDGMLGRAWKQLLEGEGKDHDEVRYPAFDLTQARHVDGAIRPGHDWVVNCSGFTDVDAAEQDDEVAVAVNGIAVGHLARRCAEVGARLVHYSTDYVFKGQATSPYAVDAPQDPVNAYGRSKAYGERALLDSGHPHLLVRTSWLYAPWGSNFVRTMLRLSGEQPELRVVDDQRGRPTSAGWLARATYRLMLADVAAPGIEGIFHVTDGGECSWYELARHVISVVNAACRVLPCTTAEFSRPAKRPAYSVLDLTKTERVLGPMRPWQRNVDDVLARLLA